MKIMQKKIIVLLISMSTIISLFSISLIANAAVPGNITNSFDFDDWYTRLPNYLPNRVTNGATAVYGNIPIGEDPSGQNMQHTVKCTTTAGAYRGFNINLTNGVTADNTYFVQFYAKLDDASQEDTVYLGVLFAEGDGPNMKNIVLNKGAFQFYSVEVKTAFTTHALNFLINSKNVTFHIYNVKTFNAAPTLTLSSSNPSNDSLVLPIDSMTVEFSNEMDNDTVMNSINYTLNDSKKFVNSVEKLSNTKYKLHFNEILNELSSYTLTISGVCDKYGQVIAGTDISFTTKEFGKPYIKSSIPANLAYGVPVDSKLTVEFSEAIQPFTTNNISINNNASVDSVTTTNNKDFIISFSNIKSSTTYTISFRDLISSATQKPMDDTQIIFSTKASDIILYENKFSNADDIAASRLSRDRATATIDTSSYCSAPSSALIDTQQYGQLFLRNNGTNVTITAGKQYTISFWAKSQGANINYWIMDGRLNNKPYASGLITNEFKYFTYTFTETESINAPYIQFAAIGKVYIDDLLLVQTPMGALLSSSDLYTDNSKNINQSTFKMYFDTKLSQSSLTGDNIKVNEKNVIIKETGENYFIFEPSQVLENDCDYDLTINIKDSGGQGLAVTRSFTTISALSGNLFLSKNSNNFKAVVTNVKNNTDKQQDATIIVIAYKNDQMIDAQFKNVLINANDGVDNISTSEISVNPNEILNGEVIVKAFFWNGLDKRIAITTSVDK